MTGIIRAAGSHAPKSPDAYQGFFSKAQWDMDTLWEVLGGILCHLLPKDQPILLVGDERILRMNSTYALFHSLFFMLI